MAKRDEIGFPLLILGLILTVSAYGFSFILNNYTHFCIVDGILDSINEEKLQNCISNTSSNEMTVYYIGFAGILCLASSSALLSKISFRKRDKSLPK